jgi:tetratricopeptide (TPR) repeat protein
MKKLLPFTLIFFFQLGFCQTAADYFNEGKRLYDTKNYADALKQFDQAIALKYNEAELYILKGNSYVYSNNDKAAVESYTKAIEIDPKSARAYYNRGTLFKNGKLYDKAVADFTSSLNADANYQSSLLERGKLYFAVQSDYVKAIADFEKYIRLNPKDDVIFATLGLCTSKLDSEPKTIAKCIDYFTKAIEIKGNDSDYYYYRGYAYYDQGNNKKALKDFDKAIEINPAYESAYFERGNIYYDLKDYQKQIENYDKAIELNPDSGKYYYWRGYAKLLGLKDKEKACIDFKKAIELNFKQADDFKSLCSGKGRTIIVTE